VACVGSTLSICSPSVFLASPLPLLLSPPPDLFHRSGSGGRGAPFSAEDAGGGDSALGQLVRNHWALAFQSTLSAVAAAQEQRGGGPAESSAAAIMALSALVASIGRRLRAGRGVGRNSGSAAFPLAFVVDTLESHAVADGWTSLLAPFPSGWLAVQALGDAGVPWSDRYDVYRALADAHVQEIVQPAPGAMAAGRASAVAAAGLAGAGGGQAGGSALALHWIRSLASLIDAWAQAQAAQQGASWQAARSNSGAVTSGAFGSTQGDDADSAAFAAAANDILSHLQHCRVVLPTLASGSVTRDLVAAIDGVRARVADVQRRVPLGAA
jgi:hypothetical protein